MSGSDRADGPSERVYRGFWRVLVRWFRVPDEPPTLPVAEGERLEHFRPAEGWLRYMKFKFWAILLPIDLLILIGWVSLFIVRPLPALILSPIFLVVAIVPDVIAYVTIHLRYDTTWYVMSERSMRLRRGIWFISETTVTFENVQNVSIRQGPLQRAFGIANVKVETAGGAGVEEAGSVHAGMIEGIADASALRDRVMARVRVSRSAGLGDERHEGSAARRPFWRAEHVELLRGIRDAVSAPGDREIGGAK